MADRIDTKCCIAGGGPAGMMLGFLLARTGVDVVVLEKHADFLRDFRGDTIHPSTLELMWELGFLDEFLKRPHEELRHLAATIGEKTVAIGDFTHLPTHCKFLALMPQWEFLDFIIDRARRYPTFRLILEAEVTGLIIEDRENGENGPSGETGIIRGVHANHPDGPLEVRAALTIGADGRHSVVRKSAGLRVRDLGAPMDVMWMKINREPFDGNQTLGDVDRGRILILINRDTYWQAAYVIPKGEADRIRARGLQSFREEIAGIEPILASRLQQLSDWNQVSLLTVTVDRLEQWSRPGLLCIGDAAHAMSPIGGVGINLAIQDAVATANLLGVPLQKGVPTPAQLRSVQKRRNFPTRATQWIQLLIQNRVIQRVLGSSDTPRVPWLLKLLNRWPILRRIPARIVGIGFRPEHIRTPDVFSTPAVSTLKQSPRSA